jgi:paraquat-inducible protein A
MGTPARSAVTELTAVRARVISCPICHLVCRQSDGGDRPTIRLHCPRCGATLHGRIPKSLMRTWAFLTAALICYLPANILPVTITTSLGQRQADTILSGVIYFATSGAWYLALVIFIASILVPLIKLLVLTFLLISVHAGSAWRPEERTRLYRIVETVGRWSMLDIFVVAVLVALVRMQSLASIEAGPGALFFGAVVVITMLAAQSFDPRLIWDAAERSQ